MAIQPALNAAKVPSHLRAQFVEGERRVVALVEESLLDLVEPLVDRLRRGVGRGVPRDDESSIVENGGAAGGTSKCAPEDIHPVVTEERLLLAVERTDARPGVNPPLVEQARPDLRNHQQLLGV